MRLEDLKGHRVGICVSGGLDSKTVTTRMREAGVDVITFTADLAQPDETDINDVARKMAPTGAETVIVDCKDAMAEACFLVLKAQATYDGGYWNTTGIARAVTVRGLLGAMQARGCTVLSHGATGRGNDQVRFERYTNVLAPKMKVFAPWRDPGLLVEFPGRKQMAEYLRAKGIEADVGPKKRYSTDANLCGLSHEAEDLESLDTPVTIVEPIMGVWPMQAPDLIEEITIRVEGGEVVAIDGVAVTPLEAMQQANLRAGRNGIWMKNALENRVVGTKSRGVYEAPGMELLGFAIRSVYQATIDRRSLRLFQQLSDLIANQIYDGRLFDPVTQAALDGIDSMAVRAHGTVKIGMYKGNLFFLSMTDVPHSLYNMADSSMEESAGLNPVSSQGFLEVQSVEALSMARAGQIRDVLSERLAKR